MENAAKLFCLLRCWSGVIFVHAKFLRTEYLLGQVLGPGRVRDLGREQFGGLGLERGREQER